MTARVTKCVCPSCKGTLNGLFGVCQWCRRGKGQIGKPAEHHRGEDVMARLADHMDEEVIDALIEPICELADQDVAGIVDPFWRDLVLAAQKIRDREGFLVTDGSELDL